MPKKWKEGMEGEFGGETEEWLRYEYLMHYAEGSLMPPLVMSLVFISKSPLSSISVTHATDNSLPLEMKAGAPFFVRPLVNMIADRVMSIFVIPTLRKHLNFLEQQLSTSAGDYLCGKDLTAADILVSYGVIAFDPRVDSFMTFEEGSWRAAYPKTAAYVDKLKNEEGYKKTQEKVKEIEGK